MSLAAWPGTTDVVSTALGPRAVSAAAAVTSLAVEAGGTDWVAPRENSGWPVSTSTTTALTDEPRAATPSGPAIAVEMLPGEAAAFFNPCSTLGLAASARGGAAAD